MIYCDYNATSPMADAVLDSVVEAMKIGWANSFSPHSLGRRASVLVEESRIKVARLVHAEPRMIRFTSGATEANSWVLQAFASKGAIYTSAIEHPSVLHYADEQIPTDQNGVIRIDVLEEMITKKKPVLISVMAANNETGVIQPISKISALTKEHKIRFHCDATQVFSKIDLTIDADFITLSAHKFGGPKGVGALVLRTEIDPLLNGGPQERLSRAGTHNVPGIVGMGTAAQLSKCMSLSQRFALETVVEELGGKVLGKSAERLPNTVCALFSVPGDLIVMALDLQGVHASTGSACSSGASKASHVLSAMGEKGIPVRFSFGADTDIEALCVILRNVITSMGQI
jgi:cysteine desulfurase